MGGPSDHLFFLKIFILFLSFLQPRILLLIIGLVNTSFKCTCSYRLHELSSEQEKVTKGNNSKNSNARVMDLMHVTSSHQGLAIHEVSFQKYKQNRSYCPDKKKRQRGITPKILMPELQTLCKTLPLIKVYPYMKFHLNSISRTGVIVQTRKVTKGDN